MAERDENYLPVALGSDGSGGTEQLTVDSVTKRLLIEVTRDASAPPLSITAEDDDNRIPSMTGDDGSGNVTPIAIGNTDHLLQIDLTIDR